MDAGHQRRHRPRGKAGQRQLGGRPSRDKQPTSERRGAQRSRAVPLTELALPFRFEVNSGRIGAERLGCAPGVQGATLLLPATTVQCSICAFPAETCSETVELKPIVQNFAEVVQVLQSVAVAIRLGCSLGLLLEK